MIRASFWYHVAVTLGVRDRNSMVTDGSPPPLMVNNGASLKADSSKPAPMIILCILYTWP